MYNNQKPINKIILTIQINRLKSKTKLIKNKNNKNNNKFKLIIQNKIKLNHKVWTKKNRRYLRLMKQFININR